MTLPHIICVMVTYNRLQYLKGAVQAVMTQTVAPNRMIIVDNHSADGTRLWLSEMAQMNPVIYPIYMDNNTGGAGGFHYGIKAAYQQGADWIWTMDDDCLPNPQTLENLVKILQLTSENIGFLASQVLWKDGTPHQMNTPEMILAGQTNRSSELVPVSYSSFVSILIHRNAIQKVGLPIKELFIYSDDVEFTQRITRSRFSAYLVPSSKVIHLTKENKGITTKRIAANPPEIAYRDFALRNLAAVNKQRPFGIVREIARLTYIWGLMILNRTPLKTQIKLIRAGLNGLLTNLQKWIEFP